jgi:rhamnosyltransferase
MLSCQRTDNPALLDMVKHSTHAASLESRAVLLVPIFNPGKSWGEFLSALQQQDLQPHQVIVLDSESTDGSAQAARTLGYTIQPVKRSQFSHGGTRQAGIDQHALAAEFVIFLTQDAILARPDALHQLLAAFDDPQVAATYGRQLPHANATPEAAHARLFNYPAQSYTVTLQDKASKGIKTCFLSNSFAAYRISALQQAGGFASDLILGEDMHLAARLLLAGHAIRYQASAHVYHSHNYSLQEEMARYFDTGVLHARQRWLMDTFGDAGSEGLKFMKSELHHLWQSAPRRLPLALLRSAAKITGFKLGLWSAFMPRAIKQGLSMHKGYWA